MRNEQDYKSPRADIIENADAFVLVADMPGTRENTVELTLEKNTLTIFGKADERNDVKKRFFVQEVGGPTVYKRTFTLSSQLDQDKISAALKDGVLTVTVPKAKAAAAKRINIQTS